jgi:hypothetical protein
MCYLYKKDADQLGPRLLDVLIWRSRFALSLFPASL